MLISASVRSRTVRTGTTMAAAVAVAGATLAAAPAAFAVGENGNIDVRSVSWYSNGDRKGVEVCKFVLVANNFETLDSVAWVITEKPLTTPPEHPLGHSPPGQRQSSQPGIPASRGHVQA